MHHAMIQVDDGVLAMGEAGGVRVLRLASICHSVN